MFAYDQPIDRIAPERAASPAPQPGFDLLQLSRLLWRRRIMIASAALIGACIAVAAGKSLSPHFTATAELYVDPRELQVVDRELTPRAQDVSGLAMVVESQARLMTSNSVLLQVIHTAHLDTDPEFGGESTALVARMLDLVGIRWPATGDAAVAQTAALEAFNRHITIRKTDRSFVVDVDVWSKEAAKAAMLANAVAQTYLAESRSSQANAARRATSDLSGRLKELQDRLRNAENALAAYKAQNNFVGTQDTLISDQQLSASNQRLAAARAQTLDAQARYDQIEANRRASGDGGATAEALQSPTLANLRAQYADARKHLAELTAELGPLHPALRQIEKQVDDLHRTIGEEIDRFAQSASNDLVRARDYEASLDRALDAQKRQSVELSQASVRLRELERDVEASRDIYQALLKRSRETAEQESLDTSAARIIGEATIPQRRAFPPAMSVLAMLGLMFGALAAGGWAVAADRLPKDAPAPEPSGATSHPPAPRRPAVATPRKTPTLMRADKPLIARLQDADVMRTLGGVLATSDPADVTRLGWPTLRTGEPPSTFLETARAIRAAAVRRTPAGAVPVVAVIGAGSGCDRSIVAINLALAGARDDAELLLIDADHTARHLSRRLTRVSKAKPHHRGRLGIVGKASQAVPTVNGISILAPIEEPDLTGVDTIGRALAQARFAGSHDMVILNGPAMPWDDADRGLIDAADALVAVLPLNLDINESMEVIIEALGPAQDRLVGVILNELDPATTAREQARQYA